MMELPNIIQKCSKIPCVCMHCVVYTDIDGSILKLCSSEICCQFKQTFKKTIEA